MTKVFSLDVSESTENRENEKAAMPLEGDETEAAQDTPLTSEADPSVLSKCLYYCATKISLN